MSELRWNLLARRWVTVTAERRLRPADFAPRRLRVQADLGRPCPFCPGNEEETPPALEAYGPHGRWLVRVLPNLYPAFAGDGQLQISVEDTGFGISKEDMPKLFDKFFRSSDPRVVEVTGTGLGLSLAQEIIRLHGGRITVESELNKGSTFLVTVPLN